MSERHDDWKTARVGEGSHPEKSACDVISDISIPLSYHERFVFVKRACLTDIRAFMNMRADILNLALGMPILTRERDGHPFVD